MESAAALWGGAQTKRILTVGSFKKQKNQLLLLKAFSEISERDLVLMLVGSGPLEPELRRTATALKISDRVRFAGFHSDPTPSIAPRISLYSPRQRGTAHSPSRSARMRSEGCFHRLPVRPRRNTR